MELESSKFVCYETSVGGELGWLGNYQSFHTRVRRVYVIQITDKKKKQT